MMVINGFLALFLSLCLLPFAKQLALSWNFVDYPDNRKRHKEAIAPVGGIIIIPLFVALSILAGLDVFQHFYFLTALTLIWLLGIVDDKYHLSATLKFSLQIVPVAILVFGDGTVVNYLGNLFGFGEIWTEPFAEIFTVLCILLVMNAINIIDGLDGLCGGICFIILAAFSCATMISGGHELVVPMFILMGCLIGFLFYNYRYPFNERAAIFLGDSGSTALGFIISWLAIELTQGDSSSEVGFLHPALILWVLALPVFDALSLFIYRLSHKRSPFSADRRHLHYLLCDKGMVTFQSVNMIHTLCLIYCLIGVLLITDLEVPTAYLMPLWISFFCIHCAVTFGYIRVSLGKVVDAN